MVQWLRLRAFTAGAQVQSLVRELKSQKLHGVAKKKKKKKKIEHENPFTAVLSRQGVLAPYIGF